MDRIYLDNNATTPLSDEVRRVLINEYAKLQANPSSSHFLGQQSKKKIQGARKQIADFFKVKEKEILFHSGATEGLNALINSHIKQNPHGHILSSYLDHACIFHTLEKIKDKGYKVSFLQSDIEGIIDPCHLEKMIINSKPSLIILSGANSETGVLLDIENIGSICDHYNIPLVLDGVALLGKSHFNISPGISAMVFSGHKIHAPKGTGFSFIRQSFRQEPLLTGGFQEFSLRAGTENLEGIVALAESVKNINQTDLNKIRNLRDLFESLLETHVPSAIVNGSKKRNTNTSNISFMQQEGETLLIQLDQNGVCASHGSACSSGGLEPSRVLRYMGLEKHRVKSAIRFSFSKFNTEDEIHRTIAVLKKILLLR
ncbi:MAG: cysteine desulfurase family protein [Rhabdochlamydiaceae bacterium]